MEKLIARNALFVILSLTVISPIFWSFFEGSLGFVLYLFGLLIFWIFYLNRTAKKIEERE